MTLLLKSSHKPRAYLKPLWMMDPGEQQGHEMLAKTTPRATTTTEGQLTRTFFVRRQQGSFNAVGTPTRTVAERSKNRLTQNRPNDSPIEVVIIPFTKTCTIGICLNISFR